MAKKKLSSYWQDRDKAERDWIKDNLAKDDQFNKVLDRSYQVAVDNINKQIEHEISRIGGVGSVVQPDQMAEYERLASQVVQKANEMRAAGHKVSYSDFSKSINDRMAAYNATMRINQLELMKSEVGTQLVDLGMTVEATIGDHTDSEYQKERKRQAGILDVTTKNGERWVSRKTINRATASVNSGAFSKNVWANVDTLKANLDGLLSTALIRGDNPREMIKYLRPLVKSTVMNQSYAAERIARTETARVQHQAQLDAIINADYKYVKWYAEPSACRICRGIEESSGSASLPDGVYAVDEVPDVPVHPNCRCSIGAYWVDGRNNSLGDAGSNDAAL
jgi:SPP1 gp7 family putative phage head morphogenesis protein